jgi:replicative DNA helicase
MTADNTVLSGRVPPQAVDVERTVLGSMLIDGNACDAAIEILSGEAGGGEDCFYVTSHRRIFSCIQSMLQNNIPVDIITLAEELRKKSWLESVGSEGYLSELVENVATSANIAYHARLLVSKAMLRQMISVSAEISTECFDADAEARTIIDRAESKIFQISETRGLGKGFESIRQLVPRTFEDIERYGKEGGFHGVETGFTKLDEMTTGLHKGDLAIVAGRPGMGKTSFALSIAVNAAARSRNKTVIAIFSLEMSKEQLVQRMLCAEAKIDMHKLRSGKLSAVERNQLSMHANTLYEAPIFIDDSPSLNIMEIRAKSRRLKVRENLGMIIIDYLQLMSSVDHAENRQQEISQISRGLKAIAKELGLPVIALSQLSRAVEQRGGDKKPQLSDLRESGAIEQDADLVMFVYREWIYKREAEELRRVADIIIGKQRNGPTGEIRLSFIPEYTQFDNLDEFHQGEGAEF